MGFKARTTAPATNNKYYIHTSKGGKNKCILISGNSCLPNCVGYAWGRSMEISGGKMNKLSLGNAELWYGNTADGYKRGSTPKLGAVICYRKGQVGVGNDGAGHVAVVEKINADGSILISESGYKSFRFKTRTLQKGYAYANGYTFQGFIYNPYVKEETTSTSGKKSNDTIADEVIAGKWGNGADRVAKLKAAGYNPTTIQNLVNKKLSGGSGKKSNETIAREVIAGKWGNGSTRKKKLEAAGYDYNAVQKIVNSLMR